MDETHLSLTACMLVCAHSLLHLRNQPGDRVVALGCPLQPPDIFITRTGAPKTHSRMFPVCGILSCIFLFALWIVHIFKACRSQAPESQELPNRGCTDSLISCALAQKVSQVTLAVCYLGECIMYCWGHGPMWYTDISCSQNYQNTWMKLAFFVQTIRLVRKLPSVRFASPCATAFSSLGTNSLDLLSWGKKLKPDATSPVARTLNKHTRKLHEHKQTTHDNSSRQSCFYIWNSWESTW